MANDKIVNRYPYCLDFDISSDERIPEVAKSGGHLNTVAQLENRTLGESIMFRGGLGLFQSRVDRVVAQRDIGSLSSD